MEYKIFKTDNETNTTTEVSIHIATSNLTTEEVVKLIERKEVSTETDKFTIEVTK